MSEYTRDLLRTARETPPMTPEEEDRAVRRAQAAVAAMQAAARPAPVRPTRRLVAVGVIAGLALAAAVALGIGRPRSAGRNVARGDATEPAASSKDAGPDARK
jgi:hypothetical protein